MRLTAKRRFKKKEPRRDVIKSQQEVDEIIQREIERERERESGKVSLVIKGVDFEIHDVIGDGARFLIKNGVDSVIFEDCSFLCRVSLIGIRDARVVSFSGCEFKGLSSCKIADCSIHNLHIYENISDQKGSNPIFLIKGSVVFSTLVLGNHEIGFERSALFDKLKVISDYREGYDYSISFVESALLSAETEISGFGAKGVLICECKDYIVEDFKDTEWGDKLEKDFPKEKYSAGSKRFLFVGKAAETIVFSECFFLETSIVFDDSEISYIEVRDSMVFKKLSANYYHGEKEAGEDKGKVRRVSVIGSYFGGISLDGRNIVEKVDFSKSSFGTAPSFHNSNIPQGSIFPGKKFYKANGTREDVLAYRTLRLCMESQRNRDSEGDFFFLEQASKLNSEHKGLKKILSLSFWYGFLSSYGTSCIRPIALLLGVFMLFSIAYSISLSPVIGVGYKIDWSIVKRSFSYSLQQTFIPFSALRESNVSSEGFGGFKMWLATLQSIISASLIALSLLAFRWRFKRG